MFRHVSLSRLHRRLGVGLAFAGLARAPVAVQAQAYTLTDLGLLPGGSYGVGLAVNNSGQVTGYAQVSAGYSRVFESAAGGGALHDMGSLGSGPSYGNGINADGRVAGYAQAANGAQHAFVSEPNGGALHDLGTLTGGTETYAFGVNASGQVVGEGNKSNGDRAAFLSGPNGGALVDLGTLGGHYAIGRAVNDTGRATGESTTAAGGVHAFLSGPNGATLTAANDLGTLGGSSSRGTGVNAAGQVVGFSSTTGNKATHAFLFSGGAMSDLGTLNGLDSTAISINGAGVVVGYSGNHAFIFANGLMTDLNTLVSPTLGYTLVAANSISDRGYITGYGTNSSGKSTAFLLAPITSPVPEASTTASLGLLLTFGVCGLAAARRRRSAE